MTAARGSRLGGIEGLRAIAALSVLVYHAWLYTLPVGRGAETRGLDRAIHELRLGLVLFFVLSGFLLFGPWVRSALSGTPAPRVRAYLTRRAARILPAYYLAIAGSIALLYPIADSPGVRLPPAGDLWLFGIFAQNLQASTLLTLNPPVWTLAVEVAFYLCLPPMGWLALRLARATPQAGKRAAVCVVPLLFGGVGLAWNWILADEYQLNLRLLNKQLPAMAPYFAVGMLAAVLVHDRAPSRRVVWPMLALGCAAVLGDALMAISEAGDGSHALWLRIWRDDLAAAGFAAILAVVATAREPLRALATAPLVWLGNVSFGVYLWHVPLLLALHAAGLLPSGWLAATLVLLAPTLLVAAASWHWLEQPVQQAARRRS